MSIPNSTQGPAPPPTAEVGDFWFDSNSGFLFTRFDDGNTVQWVVTNPGDAAMQGPPGSPGPQGPPGSGTTVDAGTGIAFDSGTGVTSVADTDPPGSTMELLSGAYTVDTVADVRGLTSHPPVVITRGCNVIGTGGGSWAWTPGDATLDNLGTVLRPTDQTVPGCYKRIFGNYASLSWWGAIGDGVIDDTDAIAAAFLAQSLTAGMRLNGEFKTYAIRGIAAPTPASSLLEVPNNSWLENAKFIDIAVVPRAARHKLFTKNSGSNVFWRNISINRNGDGFGGDLNDNASIFFETATDIWLENVEITGDDCGCGIVMNTCERVQIHSPNIHHMTWRNATLGGPTDPPEVPPVPQLNEQIAGIFMIASVDWEIVNPRIRHLRGNVAGTNLKGPPPHYQNTDGLSLSQNRNGRVLGGLIEDCGEGCDISSSGAPQFNVKLFAVTFVDCDGYGGKMVHHVDHCGYYNCTSIRAGFAGFVISGSTNVEVNGAQFVNCESIDTGASGLWIDPPAPAIARIVSGFYVQGSGYPIRNLDIRGCRAVTTLRSVSAPFDLSTVPPLIPIGIGVKVFTTNYDATLALYKVGALVRVIDVLNRDKWMEGKITAFVGTTLTVNVTSTSGSGDLQNFVVTAIIHGIRSSGITPNEMTITDFTCNGNMADKPIENPARNYSYFDGGDYYVGDYLRVENGVTCSSLQRRQPIERTGLTPTVLEGESWIIFNAPALCTVNLPSPVSWPGREITMINYAAFAVISASANVIPVTGGAVGTAILPATPGAKVTLVSDSVAWRAF